MAQLVEQLIRNQQAAGSSPASSSKSERVMLVPIFYFIKSVTCFTGLPYSQKDIFL